MNCRQNILKIKTLPTSPNENKTKRCFKNKIIYKKTFWKINQLWNQFSPQYIEKKETNHEMTIDFEHFAKHFPDCDKKKIIHLKINDWFWCCSIWNLINFDWCFCCRPKQLILIFKSKSIIVPTPNNMVSVSAIERRINTNVARWNKCSGVCSRARFAPQKGQNTLSPSENNLHERIGKPKTAAEFSWLIEWTKFVSTSQHRNVFAEKLQFPPPPDILILPPPLVT